MPSTAMAAVAMRMSQRWRMDKLMRRSSIKIPLDRLVLLFPAAYANHFAQFAHDDNPITLVSGVGGFANGLGNVRRDVVGTHDFEDHLPMVVYVVLSQFERTARATPAS